MAAWWGTKKKKPKEKTYLLVDIENGSVGSALVRLSPTEAPKLFGEKRVHLSVARTRDAALLAQEATRAAGDALRNAAEVAARLRAHEPTAPAGIIDRVAVFLGTPWGRPNLQSGKPEFDSRVKSALREKSAAFTGEVPVTFHTSSGLGAYSYRALFPQDKNVLLVTISGEMTELLLLNNAHAAAHATVPVGYRTIIRTLRTHGGYSEEEARSKLRLHAGVTRDHLHNEPLLVASDHFAEQLAEAAREILSGGPIESVVVFAHEPVGEWFARKLSEHDGFGEIFPQGGVVCAIRTHHAIPYVAAHAGAPDLFLLLSALFVDSEVPYTSA